MRKRLIPSVAVPPVVVTGEWLNLDDIASVEVSSEHAGHPIESALLTTPTDGGWRANEPGLQTVRLIFDRPQTIQRILLVIEELQFERTQEFVLTWSSPGSLHQTEIVRQQWNFNPPHNSREVEDYRVNLPDAAVIELRIVPHINGGESRASIKELRLA